jgi:Tfp pilus assembly protein PilN
MIQFNLLPDVKKEYIKAKRAKRLILSSAVLISTGCIVVVGLMFSFVQIGQKQHIDNLSKDITQESKEIQEIESLTDMLTVQNQLEIVPQLHKEKTQMSRLFDYMARLVPADAKIVRLNLDVDRQSMTIIGEATSVAVIDQLVKTLNAARFNNGDIEEGVPFSEINTRLSSDDTSASFNIDLKFDTLLFDNTKEVVLTINNQIALEQSDQPFQASGSEDQ